jgi:hypothetical protein
LRLVNFLALLVVTVLRPYACARFHSGVLREVLPVFCTQLVITLLALCALGDRQGTTPLWAEILLLAGTFAALRGRRGGAQLEGFEPVGPGRYCCRCGVMAAFHSA